MDELLDVDFVKTEDLVVGDVPVHIAPVVGSTIGTKGGGTRQSVAVNGGERG